MYNMLMALLGSGTTVAAVSFIYTLGNRVTRLEAQRDDLPELLDSKFDAVNYRLERIERALNGYMNGEE